MSKQKRIRHLPRSRKRTLLCVGGTMLVFGIVLMYALRSNPTVHPIESLMSILFGSECAQCEVSMRQLRTQLGELNASCLNIGARAEHLASLHRIDEMDLTQSINVAPLGIAEQSSAYFILCRADRAIDNVVTALDQNFCIDSVVTENEQRDARPWWQLTLPRRLPLHTIDIVLPIRVCDSFRLPERGCGEVLHPTEVPEERMTLRHHELRVELRLRDGTVVANHAFTRATLTAEQASYALPVLSWTLRDEHGDVVEVSADIIRVQLIALRDDSPMTRLYLAEVRAFSSQTVAARASQHADWRCEHWCVHGVCDSGGVCVCDEFHIGIDCSTALFEDFRHLPAAPTFHTMRALGERSRREMRTKRLVPTVADVDIDRFAYYSVPSAARFLGWWNAALATDALSSIDALQNPKATCNFTTDAIWCRALYQPGLFSFLHMVSGYLTFAHRRHRAMIINFRRLLHQSRDFAQIHRFWNYAETSRCAESPDPNCYFREWSSCVLPKSAGEKDIQCCLCEQADSEEIAFHSTVAPFEVPAPYTRKGTLWYRSVQMSYLTRLTAKFGRVIQLDETKRRLRWPRTAPVIGVHIRHADSCHTTLRAGRCLPLHAYEEVVRFLRERYDAKHVYLATDDVEIARDARKQGWMVLEHDDVRRQLNGTTMLEGRLADGTLDPFGATRSALLDTLLLAECDVLVAHFSGNMARSALELSVARHGFVVPYISMDAAYCPTWRMCCNAERYKTDMC